MTTPVFSIVICFRDWGLERLATNVRLHQRHCGDIPVEVIVSDYGSSDAAGVRAAVEAAGGRIVRTESGHLNWNRSAALNAGVAQARGEVVITTDADIFFTPNTYQHVLAALRRNPHVLYLLQCRDLPQQVDISEIMRQMEREEGIDFDRIHAVSTLRPRWGMGGLAAFTRAAFYRLNGYEERMEVWGKEDNDFAKRFHLNRMPRRWITETGTGIYHIWHESSQGKALESEEGRRLLEENKRILLEDDTPMRNLFKVFGDPVPAVSIIIPTYQRSDYLRDCLESCRQQTFGSFEVLVVENGGGRDAEAVVASLQDPRFKYVFTPKSGAAAARNVGIEAAIGRYVVIMDDDDIMLPTRVEDHLRALEGGLVHGSYGGWIDFENLDGRIVDINPGKAHSFAAMFGTGRVIMHPALMIERGVFTVFRYDESRQAGIDYALLLRMTYLGLHLRHTGSHVLLRRLHGQNMTTTQSGIQKESAALEHGILKAMIPQAEQDALRQQGRVAPIAPCRNEAAARRALEEMMARQMGYDEAFYTSTYPDVLKSGVPAHQHYLIYGRAMGRQGRA